MAKGLTAGDAVTLKEPYKVPKNEAAYQQGLHEITPDRVGHIVQPAGGRGFIVDFDGQQLVLASQRLDIARKPIKKRNQRTVKSPGAARTDVNTSESHEDSAPMTDNGRTGDALQTVAHETPEAAHGPSTANTSNDENLLDFLNYQDAGLVRLIANNLLMGGNSPDAVLLKELRFVDLPEKVQQQVRALIKAKLSL